MYLPTGVSSLPLYLIFLPHLFIRGETPSLGKKDYLGMFL